MVEPSKTLTSVGTVDAAAFFGILGQTFIAHEWQIRDLNHSTLLRKPELSPGPWHDEYVLVFNSLAQAREVVALLTCEGVAKSITLVIEVSGLGMNPPSTHTAASTNDESVSVSTVNGELSYRVYRLRSSTWTNIHGYVSSIVGYTSRDARLLPLRGRRLGVHDLASATWSAGDALARWVDGNVPISELPAVASVDLEVGQQLGSQSRAIGTSSVSVWSQLQPIDPVCYSPQGFDPFPENQVAFLVTSDGGAWGLQDGYRTFWRTFLSLNENVLAELRSYRYLDVTGIMDGAPNATARALSQLASAGIPLITGPVSEDIRILLGSNLSDMLEAGDYRDLNASDRESQSIYIRRTALKRFLPGPRLTKLGIIDSESGIRHVWPTVSVILPTKRPNLIPRILNQISQQSYSNLELIIGIHGNWDLPSSVRNALDRFPGTIRVLSFDENTIFGEVLNLLCASAEGRLITKMDDDDWYSPFHVEDLVLARQYSGAQIVGSPVEFTYLGGIDVTTRRNHGGECYTNHVAGGTIMISREDLESVGGWRRIPNAVDRGIIDAIMASGGTVYRTHGQNYVMHRRASGDQGIQHTWDASHSIFLRDVVEQWNGMVLPPQFCGTNTRQLENERSREFSSIFSNTHNPRRIV